MTKIKHNLRYIAWLFGGIILLAMVFKVIYIIDPKDNFMMIMSKIFSYNIINGDKFKLTISQLLISLGVFFIGIKISNIISKKLLSNVLDKTNLNLGSQSAIKNLTNYALIVLTMILSLNIADIPLTVFAFLGGAVAIGLGFGTQNLLNNFISGIIVQAEKPIKVGDTIEIDGKIGTVSDIGLRSTKIINSSNSHIIFPNSFFLDKSFINWTLYDKKIRSKIIVNFDYKHDSKLVQLVLQNMLDELDFVLKDPGAKIYVENFTENGVDYSLNFWYILPESGTKTETESIVRSKILEVAKKNKLEIPCPKRKIIN